MILLILAKEINSNNIRPKNAASESEQL